MAKYTIECPKCGAANTPPSSFKFWQKNMTCAGCGHEFNISQSRLICKRCPNPACGKDVIFDQKKPKEKCPYCSTLLRQAATSEYKYEEVICPQCSCVIDVDKNAKQAVCPICEKEIDVPALLAISKNKDSTGISIIKYEGANDVFVWKHPREDFNMGSKLIVHESQEAIFLMGGQLIKTFTRGEYILDTANLPIMKNVYTTATNGVVPFHAEVYFVNMTCQMGMKWGISNPISIMDPVYGVPIEIQAYGEMSLRVIESQKLLIKLVGTTNGIAWEKEGNDFSKSLRQYFLPQMSPSIVSYITNEIKQKNIDIFEISSRYDEMSAALKLVAAPIFEEFGLTIDRLSIIKIGYNENHRSYKDVLALRSNSLNVLKEKAAGEIKVAQKEADLSAYEIEVKRQRLEAETNAYKTVVEGNAAAQVELAKGTAEAQVMAAQGYNKKDEFDAMGKIEFAKAMGKAAGNGGGGLVSDFAGIGMAMGIGSQMAGQATQMATSIVAPDTRNSVWNCSCGRTNSGLCCTACGAKKPEPWTCPNCGKTDLIEKFCSNCATPKPSPADMWDCPNCDKKGLTEKFCPNCATPKPTAADKWDCPNCGKKGLTEKFCSNCATPKPAAADKWDCPNCGKKGLTEKFCSDCATPKPTAAPSDWTCPACGKTGLQGKFCSSCGASKPN